MKPNNILIQETLKSVDEGRKSLNNKKIIKITLLASILLIFSVLTVVVANNRHPKDENHTVEEIVIDWGEQNLTQEEKDRKFLDAMESSFEEAILSGFNIKQGIDVKIIEVKQLTNVIVTFNEMLELQFDEKQIDGMYDFIVVGSSNLSNVNVRIIDQDGKIIRESQSNP